MQLGAGADDPERAEHRETDRLTRLRPHAGNGNRRSVTRTFRPPGSGTATGRPQVGEFKRGQEALSPTARSPGYRRSPASVSAHSASTSIG
ncbi:hypothetical protein GCM10027259_28320 [Micromonospora palomenae]